MATQAPASSAEPPSESGERRLSAQSTALPPDPYTRAVLNHNQAHPHRIANIKFTVYSGAEVRRSSELLVNTYQLYNPLNRTPKRYGLLDMRLGISDKALTCQTCGKKLLQCTGHFGHIELKLPVFHLGFFSKVIEVLQAVCKECSSILLPLEHRERLLRRLRKETETSYRRRMVKSVLEETRKCRHCYTCGASNGMVKKSTGALEITHEKFGKQKDNRPERSKFFLPLFEAALAETPDLATYLDRAHELLTPLRVFEIFRRMSAADVELLDMDPHWGRPEQLLLTTVPVPPVCVRPSVSIDSAQGSKEDDITSHLSSILQCNSCIKMDGDPSEFMTSWDALQRACASLINSDLPGYAKEITAKSSLQGKKLRGFCQRIKGKQGRFRGNLSGKRVDFSGRTVISPDPNLAIDEVGLPREMAIVLTYPEKVTPHNIERLRAAVLNGPQVWPGALSVLQKNPKTGVLQKYELIPSILERKAASLQVGHVVNRHVCDGDFVLFNRQPSLHRMSIMCHRVRVHANKTLRFNECACAPYNADFDGDEMNVHVPQTEEARAEAMFLMGVTKNLITPRNGNLLVAATQDFLTASYMLARRDVMFDRSRFCRVITYAFDGATAHIDLPPPAIVWPVQLWTGKQVISLLLRPNRASPVLVNLRTTSRDHTKDTGVMCPKDGYVYFHNSDLVAGVLDKKTLGIDSKDNVFHVLARDYGTAEAAACMLRLTKLTTRWVANHGFSIGIEDVTPTANLLALKAKVMNEGFAKSTDEIKRFDTGEMELQPGLSLEETLEGKLNKYLSDVRSQCGDFCVANLHPLNAALIMAQAGSKGSAVNISQMITCVGQQSVNNSRISTGFIDRTLPHFPFHSREPLARGFVANAFYTGLTPTEFFFHTVAGREGLVDTAVKTAETGYMQRRLMKALEDLYVAYDNTVRNSEKGIVQFSYGDDALDPAMMEAVNAPVDFERVMSQTLSAFAPAPSEALITSMAAVSDEIELFFLSKSPSARASQPPPTASSAAASGRTLSAQRASAAGDSSFVVKQESSASSATVAPASQSLLAAADPVSLPPVEARPLWTLPADLYAEVHVSSNFEPPLVARECLSPSQPSIAEIDSFGTARIKNPYIQENEDIRGSMLGAIPKFRNDLNTYLQALLKSQAAFLERSAVERTSMPTVRHMCGQPCLTQTVLLSFLRSCGEKLALAQIEPGTAVGALGAQSIGEPSTQMTLKTFHFAGVASMNITQGVPRIKEIINASKVISTPIISAALMQPRKEAAARMVQGLVERTTLGELAESIKVVVRRNHAYMAIKLNEQLCRHLGLTVATVRRKIVQCAKLKLLDRNVRHDGHHSLVIEPNGHHGGGGCIVLDARPPPDAGGSNRRAKRDLHYLENALFALQAEVPKIKICGIDKVQRAVISKSGDGRMAVEIEGYGLLEVMSVPGVDGVHTVTNHVAEVFDVLGIEAARDTICQQIGVTMQHHGIAVDVRHLKLLADVMTFKGQVLGITRFGIERMRDSVLMQASFEKMTEHLFSGAAHSRTDSVNGVSECIIIGTPVPLGTGLMRILQRHDIGSSVVPEELLPESDRFYLLDRQLSSVAPMET